MGDSLVIFSSLPPPVIGDKDPWGKLFSIGLGEVPPSFLAISPAKTSIKEGS